VQDNTTLTEPLLAKRKGSGESLRVFYADRSRRAMLFVISIFLLYGGGAVMFWFHALYRGEKGPAISPWFHWILDSTIGFIGLTPVLFFLLPIASWGKERLGLGNQPGVYAAMVGSLFAVVTAPGPFFHNLIAGEGTPLANLATSVFGHDAAVAAQNAQAQGHSPLIEGLLQVGVGLPVYITMAWLALLAIRMVMRVRGDGVTFPGLLAWDTTLSMVTSLDAELQGELAMHAPAARESVLTGG
jgi:hypothetical protein